MTDEIIKKYLRETIEKLPEEVGKFVNENCVVSVIDKESRQGGCLQMESKRWLILLFKPFSFAVNPHYVCAHEIAHAWLGYTEAQIAEGEIEKEVEAQVEAWGITVWREELVSGNGSHSIPWSA